MRPISAERNYLSKDIQFLGSAPDFRASKDRLTLFLGGEMLIEEKYFSPCSCITALKNCKKFVESLILLLLEKT
jgi:hypothetical protein